MKVSTGSVQIKKSARNQPCQPGSFQGQMEECQHLSGGIKDSYTLCFKKANSLLYSLCKLLFFQMLRHIYSIKVNGIPFFQIGEHDENSS